MTLMLPWNTLCEANILKHQESEKRKRKEDKYKSSQYDTKWLWVTDVGCMSLVLCLELELRVTHVDTAQKMEG